MHVICRYMSNTNIPLNKIKQHSIHSHAATHSTHVNYEQLLGNGKQVRVVSLNKPTNESESYSVFEWPLEKSIKLASHYNKEDGDVSSFSFAVAIQVDPEAHLVTISA